MNSDRRRDRLDLVTSKRLAQLASRPVDTSRLERRLDRALLAESMRKRTERSLRWQRWWRPITTAAAAVLIVVSIGWLMLNDNSSAVLAAPVDLAQIHYDVTHGLAPHLTVSNVAEANRLLADQANGVVPVPDLPGAIKSCCLHKYAGTTLTCALIERDGTLISVAVANGAELHSPIGDVKTRGGRTYTVHKANGVNMVMSHHDDRWLCVMGESGIDQLLEVAAAIRF